ADAPFFDEVGNLEKLFPFYVSFGTLWITALVEQVYMFDKIYPGQIDKDREQHLTDLKDAIASYTQTAQTTYDKLYEWRFSLLQIKEWQTNSLHTSYSEWTFVDKYPPGYTAPSGSSMEGDHNPNGRLKIETEARKRVAEINGDFVEKLQATLLVAR